jgi:hypothetical protein
MLIYIISAACTLLFLFLVLILLQKRSLFNKFSPLFDPFAILVAILFGIYSLNHAKEELEATQGEMKGLNNTLRTIVETATTSKVSLQNVNKSLLNVATQLDTFSFSMKEIVNLSNSQLQIWQEQQKEYQRKPIFYISFKNHTINDSIILLEDPIIINKGNIEGTLDKINFYCKNYLSSSFQLVKDTDYYSFSRDLPKMVLSPEEDYLLPYTVIELKNKDTELYYRITFKSLHYYMHICGLFTFSDKKIKATILNDDEWLQHIHKR